MRHPVVTAVSAASGAIFTAVFVLVPVAADPTPVIPGVLSIDTDPLVVQATIPLLDEPISLDLQIGGPLKGPAGLHDPAPEPVIVPAAPTPQPVPVPEPVAVPDAPTPAPEPAPNPDPDPGKEADKAAGGHNPKPKPGPGGPAAPANVPVPAPEAAAPTQNITTGTAEPVAPASKPMTNDAPGWLIVIAALCCSMSANGVLLAKRSMNKRAARSALRTVADADVSRWRSPFVV